ncbi:MAG: CHASE domain-containing protein, partial [Rhodocyclaceae bacterium]|nr:CHASE domain-containing protein [Rhodocyclaceae bacterium]
MNSFFSWLLRPVPLGILVTLATMFSAFYTARQQQTLVTSLEQTRLEQLATLAKARVSARIEDYISLCLGLRNLFVLNPAVNRAEFARAVENLQLRDRFPEIKNVAFSRYLAASERAAFEERVRTDTSLDPKGYPDFSIHPPGERSEYFVADYLWPMAGNERIHGLDISAQPVNLLSMRHSRDTAQPVASGPFDLLQEQSERTGFVVRVPVFITAAEGGSGFLGSVAVTTRVLDMVHWLTLHENLGELSLTLTDLGSNLPGFDLASGPGASRLLYAPKPSDPAVSTISRALQIEVYGRTWQLEVQPILPLLSAAERNLPRSIQVVGGTIALLLGWLAYFLARSRTAAEQREQSANLAVQRSEERFRSLLRDVPTVAVQGYRADGTITYWNRACEKVYGYSAEEALGRKLIDLIIPPELRDAVRNDIQTMVDTGTPAPVAELALQRKDGTRVSVLTSHAVV